MQQLLHEAIPSGSDHCFGLLTGNGNLIKNSIAVTHHMLPIHAISPNTELIGIYQCSDSNKNSDCGKTAQLAELFRHHQKEAPCFYLHIALGNKGRIDVHLYSDAELKHPITLQMQEDTDPIVSNHR